MRKLLKVIFHVWVSIFLFSCQPNNCEEFSHVEKEGVVKEIQAVMDKYENIDPDFAGQAIALRADIDGYVKALNGKIEATDYSKVKEQIEPFRTNGTKVISRVFNDIHIFPLSKTSASCTFLFQDTYLFPTYDTMKVGGNWTFVFVKLGDSWKVVHEAGDLD